MTLTDSQIDQLQGEELNKAVAEHVMGWERKYDYKGKLFWETAKGMSRRQPFYSFIYDMNCALEVVENLRNRGLLVYMSAPAPDRTKWEVRGWNDNTNNNWFIAFGDTLPEAICKVALKAVRGE